MCPDRDLLSAYLDGEVPSPWRERLEEHMAACADCAALAAGYSALRETMRAEADSVKCAAAESAALARGRDRLEALLAEAPGIEPRGFRGRSVSLPLPFAAAAAFLVILLGGATAVLALKPATGPSIQAVASGELVPLHAQPASMDELLSYLNASDGQVTLTINLPTGTTFGSAGKPVIMRRDQVLNGITVGDSSP